MLKLVICLHIFLGGPMGSYLPGFGFIRWCHLWINKLAVDSQTSLVSPMGNSCWCFYFHSIDRFKSIWKFPKNPQILHSWSMEKLLDMATNGAGSVFPTNPDLVNILGDMDFDFENSQFWIWLIPKFQISKFPNFQLGQAGLGPWAGWNSGGPLAVDFWG